MELSAKTLPKLTQETNIKKLKLSNGSVCVIAPLLDNPLTCIDLWIRAGSASEEKGEEGLAHFLEHMVFKGSDQLKEGEFDFKIESLGGSSNAATGFDDVHFHVQVPSEATKEAIKLLINLVLKPSIEKDSFDMEREVVLEEIAQHDDQPEEVFFERLFKRCWTDHPYGRSILGTKKSLNESSPLMMKDFHKRLYRPENIVLSIAGDPPIDIERFLEQSELAKLKKPSSHYVNYLQQKKLKFTKGREEIVIARLESARLAMAWPVAPAKERDQIIGADIATTLLAEGRRSRLVKRLREELKIVESIDMYITVLEQGSLICLESSCLERDLSAVEDEINKILKEATKTKLSEKEMHRSRQLVRNSIYFSLETSSQVASIVGSHALWDRSQPLLHPLNYIDNWTGTRLQEQIINLIQPDESFTLVAKPAKH